MNIKVKYSTSLYGTQHTEKAENCVNVSKSLVSRSKVKKNVSLSFKLETGVSVGNGYKSAVWIYCTVFYKRKACMGNVSF